MKILKTGSKKLYPNKLLLGSIAFLIWATTVFANPLQASLDSTVVLKAFTFEASRYTKASSGQKSEQLDSSSMQAPLAQNLSELLVAKNSFFVKSYGLGGLSTGSFRGTSASQTATLWNGFNLQSSMNGLLDYALIPALFLDEVNLNYGGSAALYGSGSVGGTILLNNVPKFNSGFTATLNSAFGSYDNYQQGAKLAWSNSKVATQLRIFHHSALNNFPYINTAESGKPKQYQQNAALEQSGALLENYLRVNEKQKLSIRLWYQNSDRQIPAAMLSKASKQNQVDKFYRANAEYDAKIKQHHLMIRAAYFDEELKFNDSDIQLFSTSRSHTFIAEAEDTYYFAHQFAVNVGINNTQISASSDGYGISHPNQNRTALFVSLHHQSKQSNWKNQLSLRKELYGQKLVPLTLSLGTEKLMLNFLKVRGTLSRNYRLPTFNDLFWQEQGAAGNPELKPESGWSADAGIVSSLKKNKLEWNTEASVFSNAVKDMIVWSIQPNAVWTPQNLNSVWSRGFEAGLKASYTFTKLSVALLTKYSYTLSTDQDKNAASTSFQKQLFYVPKSNYSIQGTFIYKGFQLTYLHNYIGKRFTNNQNTEYLPAYSVASLSVSKQFTLKQFGLNLYFQALNLWGQTYQIIAWRPMPLLNYQIGTSICFQKKIKKSIP